MPVYNSGIYLRTAVDSILNQSFKDIELILVDDGSTDGSSECCDEYAKQDSRVVVIHQKNGGICNARNAALKIARGEYIGFSDHDDKFLPEAFDRCVQAIREYAFPDMIKFGKRYVFINEKNEAYRCIHMSLRNKVYTRTEITENYLQLRADNLFRFVWDGLYKKNIIKQHNIAFDPYFTHGGEDHDFCNTYSRHINNIVTIDQEFYVHYLRKSFSTSSKKIQHAGCLYYKLESERLYETLSILNYDVKRNDAIYWNQFFGTCILPVISYHIKNGTSKQSLFEILNQFEGSPMLRAEKNIRLYKLLKDSKKIGLFTHCYLRHHLNLLYLLILLRYRIIKS